MRTKLRMIAILALLAAQLAVGVCPAEAASPPVHVVRRGETLYSIARRYGTTVEALMRANGLTDPTRIYAGQRLVVPAQGTAQPAAPSGNVHIVQRGENLFRIALRYGTTAQAIARANNLRSTSLVYAGQRLVIPVSRSSRSSGSDWLNPLTHVVQRGENLFRIALRYGTTAQAIARANNLPSTSLVYVGQRLIIPRRGAATAPAPKPAPAPVQAPTSGKWIDVNLTTQSLVAYEGQRPVYWATVSTGRARTPTPTGRYRIYKKLRSTTMSGPGYRFRDVPHVMYFHGNYTLHGTYWHHNFGRPMSHGCVNLRLADAQWLYEWAPVGTLVVIHR